MSNDKSEESKDDKIKQNDELRTQIDVYKNEKKRLQQNLETDVSSVTNEVSNFSVKTKGEQSRFNITAERIFTDLENYKIGAKNFIEKSNKTLSINIKLLKEVSIRIINALKITLTVFSISFIGLYLYLNGIKFDRILLVGIGTGLIIYILIRISTHYFNKKINEVATKINEDVLSLSTNSPNIPTDYLKTANFFNDVEKDAIIVESKVKGIIKNAKDFVPLFDKISSTEQRHNNQVNFRKTLENALLLYRLPLGDPKVIEYLANFNSFSDSELDWLNEASNDLNSFINIDPSIMKLCYFDYTNDYKNLPNAWNKIVHDEPLLTQFVRILIHNTFGEKQSENYGAFVELARKADPFFRLTEFERSYYEFFVEFKRKKVHLKSTITHLGYELENINQKIDDFRPKSLEEKKWEDQIIKEISDDLVMDSKFLMLFYFDRISVDYKKNEIWHEMLDVNNNFLFDKFVDFVTTRHLLKIPEHYQNNPDLLSKIKYVMKLESEFDFIKITQSVFSQFKNIDGEKASVLQSLGDYNIIFESQNSEKEFKSFIPLSDEILTSIVEELQRILKIDSKLILLFYASKYDKNLMQNTFSKIQKTSIISELAKTLLENKLIKTETKYDEYKERQNLSSILDEIDEFNLIKVQSWFQTYGNLLENTRKLVQFLTNEKLVKNQNIEFKHIMQIVPNPLEDRLFSILSLSLFILQREGNFSDFQVESISKACVCLFLFNQEDPLATRCGQLVQLNDTSTKILFHNMNMKDKGGKKEEYALLNVIDDVLNKHELQFPHLIEFKIGLSGGVLFRSATEMMSKKLDDVRNEYKKETELQAEIRKIESSVRTFLGAEIEKSPQFLEYAIQSQLVQAYIITSTSKGPALTEILGSEVMKTKAKEILAPNEIFEDFLIISDPKIHQASGKWTRIGVVPFHTDFYNFCEKFEKIFDTTVDEFLKTRLDLKKSDFSLNIFRMLATQDTFKRIHLDGKLIVDDEKISNDNPIKIIKNLIINRFSVDDSISIVATSGQQEEGVLSMKKLIVKFFDQQMTLHSFLKDNLSLLFSSRNDIDNLMRKDEFDQKIYNKFSVSGFTELAKVFYNSNMSTVEAVKKDVTKRIDEVFIDFKINLSEEECNTIADSILLKLQNLGKFFSY